MIQQQIPAHRILLQQRARSRVPVQRGRVAEISAPGFAGQRDAAAVEGAAAGEVLCGERSGGQEGEEGLCVRDDVEPGGGADEPVVD